MSIELFPPTTSPLSAAQSEQLTYITLKHKIYNRAVAADFCTLNAPSPRRYYGFLPSLRRVVIMSVTIAREGVTFG